MSNDIFDIEGQEDAIRKKAEKERLQAEVEKSDLIWLMKSARGRRIIYGVLADAGVWQSSFHTNALQMAFNEGRRNYGLKLLSKVMAYCPEQYPQMMTENTND